MKRLLLFVHYNSEDKLENRSIHSLKKIRHLYTRIVVVSNSGLSVKDLSALKVFSDKVIFRDNIGFDFSAWKEGMENIGWSKLKEYDTVTLMNDTCYFPIQPIDDYIEYFDRNKSVDFWGASIHRATIDGMPGTNGPIPEHLQSYFLCFKKNVVRSKTFQEFWTGVNQLNDVKTVIREYETKLTNILSSSGFKYDAIINIKSPIFSEKTMVNPAYQDPLRLLHDGFPFIKIKAVSKYNLLVIKRFVDKKGLYPSKYIRPYRMTRIIAPIVLLLDFLRKKHV